MESLRECDEDEKKEPELTELQDHLLSLVIQSPKSIVNADVAHSKKSLPKHFSNFKDEYELTNEHNPYGFTNKYLRLIVDNMFTFAFDGDGVETVEQAKEKIEQVLMRHCPIDKDYSECKEKEFTWCKTATGQAEVPNKSNSLGRTLPIGIGETFRNGCKMRC